ncbi:hypothetical protein BJX99DRAFT_253052 [Aspergillus californicus]
MSSQQPNFILNPNPNRVTTDTTQPDESFTDRFNENVDYSQDKSHTVGGKNVAQAQADAQDQDQGVGVDIGDQRATEIQTSIDSTNAGVDHSRSRYSFTAETLAHPED